MARINIEDSIYADVRFVELVQRKGGNMDAALGALVRAWGVAQKHFLSVDNDRLIPLAEWNKHRLSDEIIEVGLAERREKGIYLCGAETQFAWLIQRQNAGKKPKTKKKKQPKATDSTRKRDQTARNPREALSLSLSLSHSQTQKNPPRTTSSEDAPSPVAPLPGPKTQDFIAAYCDAYKAQRGTHPVIDGKQAGAAKRVLKAMSLERASELVKTYLAWQDPWFVRRGHDLVTFADSLNRISQKHDTGRVATTTGAHKAEQDDFYREQLEAVRRGDL